MSDTLSRDLFLEMMTWGFINQARQFKQGLLMNDDGKRLLIKPVHPKKAPADIDVFMQYAHVVSVDGQAKCDPGVILGFDLNNKEIHPVLYRNDLLDHTISVYENGDLNQDHAMWLLEYWSALFDEIKTTDYDYLDQPQLKAG